MSIETRLAQLVEKMTRTQTQLDQLNGKLEAYKERLRLLGCSSTEQANKEIARLTKKNKLLEKELTNQIEELENQVYASEELEEQVISEKKGDPDVTFNRFKKRNRK